MSTNNACYDVKPANIMLTHLDDGDEQQTLPTDFGIARKVDDALSGSQRGLACRRTPVQTLHQHGHRGLRPAAVCAVGDNTGTQQWLSAD